MHFDALTLACVTHELQQTICPGRIQQVLMVDEQSIGLEIYAQSQRYYLLLSAGPKSARVHLVSEKLRRGSEAQPPLLQLLRKYARDALLTEIEQPNPFERTLHLRLQHLEHGTTTLVAEPMGRLSNLLLLNRNNQILDCLRRVPAGEHSQRVLLPGHPYAPPPVQDKLPPLDDGSEGYYQNLAKILESDERLWKVLVAQIAGISPTLARETAFRASGNIEVQANAVDVIALAAALQELWSPLQNGEWQPGIWIEAALALKSGVFPPNFEKGIPDFKQSTIENGAIVGFSAFVAHIRGEFSPTNSISAALERYFAAQSTQPNQNSTQDSYSAQRKQVAIQVEAARRRLQRQLAALAGDEPALGAATQARTQAEWLLAYSSQIEPGQTILSVDLGDERLEIVLDQQKSPVEQAQQLFKQAARMERASRFIPQRRSELQRDLDYLDQLAVDLDLATNQPEIAAVRGELEMIGLLGKQKQGKQKQNTVPSKAPKTGQPLTVRSPAGMAILVGRSARQNEEVTFKLSHPRDLWLHVRNVPGAHVIIRSSGAAVDDATLQLAAQLAGYHSKLRGEKSVEVIVCERRFVQHAPGGRMGQVTMRNERVINASAAPL